MLLRLTAVAATFAFALAATFAWQLLPVLSPPPGSAHRLVGVLSPAIIETPMWPASPAGQESPFWIVRRGQPAAAFDVNRPVAFPARAANLITVGCTTLTVSVDEARKLRLNTETMGSLDDPSRLKTTLAEIFRERAVYRAYSPEMEDRAELPAHERIEKTALVIPSASLTYGEVVELLSIIEQAGASPVVLQVGDSHEFFAALSEIVTYE